MVILLIILYCINTLVRFLEDFNIMYTFNQSFWLLDVIELVTLSLV